jgi:pilus assembly protein CpaF
MANSLIDAQRIKEMVRARLLGDADGSLDEVSPPERRLRVRAEVAAVLREERAILPAAAVTEMVNQVSDEVVGLGPIERLLKDPEVSEVMVNGADDVFVERKGRIERVDGLFFEGEELRCYNASSEGMRTALWALCGQERPPNGPPRTSGQTVGGPRVLRTDRRP